MIKTIKTMSIFVVLSFIFGCAPEVGSKRWCEKMDKTPKSEWSMSDAKEYAKNCVFRKK